jgi:hypothetical protein
MTVDEEPLLGADERDSGTAPRLLALDLRRVRLEISRADDIPAAVAVPQACELDDLGYAIIWRWRALMTRSWPMTARWTSGTVSCGVSSGCRNRPSAASPKAARRPLTAGGRGVCCGTADNGGPGVEVTE